MVALLNTGSDRPADARVHPDLRLEPGKRYVTIETTIKNTSSGAHPFPFLDPRELDALIGSTPTASPIISNLRTIQLSAPLGPVAADRRRAEPVHAGRGRLQRAVRDRGQLQRSAGGFPAFPGMVVDYLASRGPGVSYGLAMPATIRSTTTPTALSGYPGPGRHAELDAAAVHLRGRDRGVHVQAARR